MDAKIITKEEHLNLDNLNSRKKAFQRELDKRLQSIKLGNIKDSEKLDKEIKVLRENLTRCKEAMARANSVINPNIYSLKDLIEYRNAIYTAKEKKNEKLMSKIKEINEEIANHRKVVNSYNKGTSVAIKLLIIV